MRQSIDTLDREIVRLIGARSRYVNVAAKLKSSAADVRAPERQTAMLAARRRWAEQENLDPNFIESLYKCLITYFVSQETSTLKKSG